MSGSLGVSRPKLLLQHRHDRIVPGVMKILLRRRDVDALACPAAVSVRRRMERLMDVADDMNEKR